MLKVKVDISKNNKGTVLNIKTVQLWHKKF